MASPAEVAQAVEQLKRHFGNQLDKDALEAVLAGLVKPCCVFDSLQLTTTMLRKLLLSLLLQEQMLMFSTLPKKIPYLKIIQD